MNILLLAIFVKVRLFPYELARMLELPLSESGISCPILKLSDPELLPFDLKKLGKLTCLPFGFFLESNIGLLLPPLTLVVVLRFKLRLLLCTKALPPLKLFNM